MSERKQAQKIGFENLARIFLVPFTLFAVSLFGLVAALLVEGTVDLLLALAAGCGLIVAMVALALNED